MFLLAEAAQNFPGTYALWTISLAWPWVLGALAVALLLSGIDDLIPVLICALSRLRAAPAASASSSQEAANSERRIAIFVPCWKESDVIGNMVRHNLSAIRYRNFDLFLGVYPNDEETVRIAHELAENFRNVHVAACPHPGPTSKADCLNWIYQRMARYEVQENTYFDTIVLHDAEDLIHPQALALIDRERARHAMVQVPVLPLPTPVGDFTHGIYCDEFAEYQTIDMRARQFSRSFIPSNGVGTGFAREILERLARERQNRIFDPASLTEDYEIGVYIHRSGFSQLFAPLSHSDKDFVATREFFPGRVRSAIRQRTRWLTGIALQGWERDGWRGSWRTRYWFWRDRKGLVTNPLSLLTNLVFLAGLTDWIVSLSMRRPWWFAVANPLVGRLCVATASLQLIRLVLRSLCVANLYGMKMGATVLFRCLHANFVNCVASLCALRNYTIACVKHSSLKWDKTDHIYPTQTNPDISESGD